MFSLRSLFATAILLTFAGCPRKRDDPGTATAAPAASEPTVVDEDAGTDAPPPEPPPMPGSGGTGDAGPFR